MDRSSCGQLTQSPILATAATMRKYRQEDRPHLMHTVYSPTMNTAIVSLDNLETPETSLFVSTTHSICTDPYFRSTQIVSTNSRTTLELPRRYLHPHHQTFHISPTYSAHSYSYLAFSTGVNRSDIPHIPIASELLTLSGYLFGLHMYRLVLRFLSSCIHSRVEHCILNRKVLGVPMRE